MITWEEKGKLTTMEPTFKENWLIETLDNEPNLPLLVIDFKVYAHFLNNYIESAVDIVGDDEGKLRTVIRALWAFRLNRGIDSLPVRDFTAIVVDDYKDKFPDTGVFGYWRSQEAFLLGMPEYKGGRPPKPSLFHLVLEEGYRYIQSPGSTFHFNSKRYYEADDIAGKIARIQRTDPALDRYVLLSTVDGDWQGLVSDEHRIVWCNTGPWQYRIRCEAEVCDYYLRKEKLDIKTARETYTVKVEVGDAGDNLLPGTPLRFFDLYEEDEVWGWTPDEEATLRSIIADTKPSNRRDHLTNAGRFLKSIGMFMPEIPPPTPYDIASFGEKAERERREGRHPGPCAA
jgi:5''-3'' exonuclease, N-terminal resolvase-like domain.